MKAFTCLVLLACLSLVGYRTSYDGVRRYPVVFGYGYCHPVEIGNWKATGHETRMAKLYPVKLQSGTLVPARMDSESYEHVGWWCKACANDWNK